MENGEVARVLYEVADYLELQGVSFKPQAYRRAARSVEQLDGSLEAYHEEGRLGEIPGVGKAIAEKIGELITTGKLRYLDDLKGQTPQGLLELLEVPEIGPKTAMLLYRQLGIESIDELKRAIFEHKLSGLKGFGPRSEERILQGIRVVESRAGRCLLNEAFEAGRELLGYLKRKHPDAKIELAGSLRRMKETIGDLDILVATERPDRVMESFLGYESVSEVLASGDTKSSIRLSRGIQVDLRAVPPESYGAALQYFTGSKEHNVELRKLAISKRMKMSEYGLFDRDSDEPIAGQEERGVYEALGLQFIPPEMRENRGEIELASKNGLPEIIEYDELKGDLHCHSEWSGDASGTFEEIWKKASQLGYDYCAITDHSRSLHIVNGLSEDRLLDQAREIGRFRESHEGPWLLSGSEVDILADGRLDYPDETLDELDFAVISVHSRFNMSEKEMTERIVSAMSHDKVRVFAHPTGRLIGQRPSCSYDFEKVVTAAVDNDVSFEVNSFPDRLDLSDLNVRRATEMGARISINSDAHSPAQMELVRFGIATARRGWARRTDVTNTWSIDRLKREWGLQ